MTFDVAVVGAGIHGASAAFHLASRGVRIVIFEQGTPAGGPTGRSSAICRAYYTNPFLARAARDSIQMLAHFDRITGMETSGYRRTGALFLHPPEDAPKVERVVPELNRIGITAQILGIKELAARFPSFDLEGIELGVWEPDAGYADPFATTHGFFRRAVELGAEPRLGTQVTRIEVDAGQGFTLLTSDGGRTSCDRVLIAAGPWTKPLAGQVGVDLPLTVERHIVGTFRWGGGTRLPLHADLASSYYLRPEGGELFLVGRLSSAPPADPDHFNERATDLEIAELSGLLVRRAPALEMSEVHGGWASLYDVSPDWQPVIGEISPGVFVDAGTSGHGFKLAPALGRHVADLVMGERPDPSLDQFHPRRFDRGRVLAAGYGEARILG